MNANELMTREPRSVRTTDRLDAVARVLWEQDCGIVPVVDAANVLVGVLTDRDLCMAAYTQGRLLNEIAVSATMARSLRSCRPDDTVATVLATMQQAQVHRLPVVDTRGILLGIVSITDVVRAAHGRPAVADAANVVKTLAAIGTPRRAVGSEAKRGSAAAGAPGPKAASAATTSVPEAVKASMVLAPAPATRGAAPGKSTKGRGKGKQN